VPGVKVGPVVVGPCSVVWSDVVDAAPEVMAPAACGLNRQVVSTLPAGVETQSVKPGATVIEVVVVVVGEPVVTVGVVDELLTVMVPDVSVALTCTPFTTFVTFFLGVVSVRVVVNVDVESVVVVWVTVVVVRLTWSRVRVTARCTALPPLQLVPPG
jgi:hypothetical protein